MQGHSSLQVNHNGWIIAAPDVVKISSTHRQAMESAIRSGTFKNITSANYRVREAHQLTDQLLTEYILAAVEQ